MRILVVGAGAVGGYFGGRLAEIGRDVTFLLRPRRAEQVRTQGLQIVSPRGDAHLHPPVVTAAELRAPFDCVVLSVKAYALESALADMRAAVGPHTMILPLLNGMRHLDLLDQRFGADAVLGGLCLCVTTLDEAGRIVQMAPIARMAYGERDGSITPRVQALDEQMQGALFDARLSSEIMQDMWNKWVMLAATGGVTCLMRGTTGDVASAPGGVAFARRMLAECAAVARSAGYEPGAEFLREIEAMLTDPGSPQTSSMYRDLVQGGPVEVDHLLGDLLARGERAGLDMPLIAAARTHLAVYQRRLKS